MYPEPVSKWALMCVSRIDIRQWPVSTLSLSLPASHPRPDHWHWSPVSGRHRPQYTCTASASRHQPRPAQTLSYFPCSLRPQSVCDGNLKSEKMLSPPAVTATAVKTKGFRKKTSKLNLKLNQSLKKQRKKETTIWGGWWVIFSVWALALNLCRRLDTEELESHFHPRYPRHGECPRHFP